MLAAAALGRKSEKPRRARQAIARAIVVEKHGGSLGFETEPGHGTTFFIRLPVGGGSSVAAEAAA